MQIPWHSIVPAGKVYLIMISGYLFFHFVPRARPFVPWILKISINILLPLYFIYNLPAGWGDAISAGWQWLLLFFLIFLGMMSVQFLSGYFFVGRKWETLFLMAFHNAGYLPFPILAAFAPKALLVYMYFYFLAFNLVFWTVSVSYFGREKRRINMPVIGIIIGVAVAASGIYSRIPLFVELPIRYGAEIALPAVLFLAGSVLGTISLSDIRFRREYLLIILIKMIIYPALFFVIFRFVHFSSFTPDLAAAAKTALILEAAVPPATNILLTAKAYGTESQVQYVGGAVFFTYILSFITVPLFLIASFLVFG